MSYLLQIFTYDQDMINVVRLWFEKKKAFQNADNKQENVKSVTDPNTERGTLDEDKHSWLISWTLLCFGFFFFFWALRLVIHL